MKTSPSTTKNLISAILFVTLALLSTLFSSQTATTAQAQTSCPTACEATSLQCRRVGSTTAPACPKAWQNVSCGKMPCAYRQACGCGGCLLGCNQTCSTCKGTGSTGGSQPGGQPGGTQPAPGNPSTPSGTSPDSAGGSGTNATPAPLTPECKTRCDRDGDGIITKDDFKDLIGQASDPAVKELLTFCSQSCPLREGNGTGTLPTGGFPTGTPDPRKPSDVPTGTPNRLGDCSGPTPGKPDGVTNIIDIEYFRQELNKEVTTLSCDLDHSGEVDIIDFTNFIRPAFSSSSDTGTPGPLQPSGTPGPLQPSDTPSPTTSITPAPTQAPTAMPTSAQTTPPPSSTVPSSSAHP